MASMYLKVNDQEVNWDDLETRNELPCRRCKKPTKGRIATERKPAYCMLCAIKLPFKEKAPTGEGQ